MMFEIYDLNRVSTFLLDFKINFCLFHFIIGFLYTYRDMNNVAKLIYF